MEVITKFFTRERGSKKVFVTICTAICACLGDMTIENCCVRKLFELEPSKRCIMTSHQTSEFITWHICAMLEVMIGIYAKSGFLGHSKHVKIPTTPVIFAGFLTGKGVFGSK